MVLISKAKYIPVNKHNMHQKGFSAFASVQQCTLQRDGEVPESRHCYCTRQRLSPLSSGLTLPATPQAGTNQSALDNTVLYDKTRPVSPV